MPCCQKEKCVKPLHVCGSKRSAKERDALIEQQEIYAELMNYERVSLAPQFIRYTVNCTSRDSASHLLTHLVVYIIARCSSLNTTTFCLIHVCPVLPHPTERNINQLYGLSKLSTCLQWRGISISRSPSGRKAEWRSIDKIDLLSKQLVPL
jgi:hypothetical protein